MKLEDIELGTEYAVRRYGNITRMTAERIAKRPPGTRGQPRPRGVQMSNGAWIHAQQVMEPWQTYADRKAASQARHQARIAERERAVVALGDQLRRLGLTPQLFVDEFGGHAAPGIVRLRRLELHDVVRLTDKLSRLSTPVDRARRTT